MIGPGQRQKDTKMMITGIFNVKSNANIASWNVWTLYQCSHMAKAIRELDSYKTSMIDVSKNNWMG